MAQHNDSVVERAQRVEHTLHTIGDTTVQVAVGGPCPECGNQVETVPHSDSRTISCQDCGTEFPVAA